LRDKFTVYIKFKLTNSLGLVASTSVLITYNFPLILGITYGLGLGYTVVKIKLGSGFTQERI